jgi:glycosyltransferase involved in cell wall biosynthesis
VTARPSVMHFTTTGDIAGAEQLLVDLSNAHDRALWNVSYGTLLAPGEMNRQIQQNGAPCYSLEVRSAFDVPLATIRLAGLLRKYSVNILHTHLLHGGLVGFLAARLSGLKSIKLVHTRHHSDELHRFGPSYRAKLDAFVARSHDFVCANSKAAIAVLVDLESVPERKIRLTYPGVDIIKVRGRVTDSSGMEIRRELNLSATDFVVGSVAHLLPKKGHATLIRAMVEVVCVNPGAKLIIAGKGPERQSLERLVREQGLENHVFLVGFRQDVPNLIRAFDLFVQPSLEEAFGVAIVEAMTLDKAVIGSETGGIPEVVSDSETGLLVPPGDESMLAKAILKLMTDRDLCRSMAGAGSRRAEQLFSICRHAADYEAVWAEALSK